MRLVLLIFGLLATAQAASLKNFKDVEPENNNALDEIMARWLRSVIANLADPHYVPIREVEDFNFGNSLVTLRGHMRNINIRGLNGIVVNRINVNWQNLRFDFDITVPHMSFSGNWYDLRGRFVNILPIFGNGPFTIDLWNLNINGHTTLGQMSNGMLEMRSFNTRLRLQTFLTNFHNLLFGGEFGDLWNYIFSDMLPAILNNFHPEVTQIVEQAMIPFFNERLNGITRDDLWDIIHGRRTVGDQFIESLIELVFAFGTEAETEKPEPYRMETEKPEPYRMETEKPEPYRVETEKPEPYFARTSLEPYETEKPEPYRMETEKPEPYRMETEKPEPYRMETEKPEPYFARTSLEPYETEKPEPYRMETEKPEPYRMETEKPEPYRMETEKPEPYRMETEKPEPYRMETEKPEPYRVETEKPEPYRAETEKPEPYFARTSLEPYEVETEKPEPYNFDPELEHLPPVIRIPIGKNAWITSITLKNVM